MTLWIHNQLPPALAGWMRATLSIDCLPVRDLSLQRATDHEIFAAARGANVVVLTKDADFVELLEEHGPPPQVVLVTCGNTSNARLRRLVQMAWPIETSTAAGRPPVAPNIRIIEFLADHASLLSDLPSF